MSGPPPNIGDTTSTAPPQGPGGPAAASAGASHADRYRPVEGDQLPAEPRADIVRIVTRAHRLGFCHRRVATALAASRIELALIEHGLQADRESTHHEGIHGR